MVSIPQSLGSGVFFFDDESPIEFAKSLANFISSNKNMRVIAMAGNSRDEYMMESYQYGWIVLVGAKHD